MGECINERRVKARKLHNCFLCCVVIPVGEVHDTWRWVDDGCISQMRVHDACKSYAHDKIEDWANGDGVDENAVAEQLWEEIVVRGEDWKYSVDEKEIAETLATWPNLAFQIDYLRKRVAEENE